MEKFDKKDLRLLAELDNNSRASLSELAKKVHMSREAVNYRIKGYVDRGIITKFVTHVDYTRLGHTVYSLFFKFGIMNEKEEHDVITYLKNLHGMNWAAALGGRFDFVLEFPAESLWEFKAKRREILSKYPGKLITHDVAIVTQQQRLNRRYLYPIPSKIEDIRKDLIYIDKKDEMIIEELKGDARVPLVKVAKKVGLPASTVAKRILELKKNRVLRCFTAHINPAKYGYHRYKTCIKLAEYSEKIKERIEAFCEQMPNVVYYLNCVGQWDYEIDFDVESSEQYQRYLRQFRNLFGSQIEDLETLEIFHAYKFNY